MKRTMPMVFPVYKEDEDERGRTYLRPLSYHYTFQACEESEGSGFDVRGLAVRLGLIQACPENFPYPRSWPCHIQSMANLRDYQEKTGESHEDIIRRAFEAGLITEKD